MKDFKVVLKFTRNGVQARCVKNNSENQKKKVDKQVEKK